MGDIDVRTHALLVYSSRVGCNVRVTTKRCSTESLIVVVVAFYKYGEAP